MQLICLSTGVKVEASDKQAEALIASGSFAKAEAKAAKATKATKKETTKEGE